MKKKILVFIVTVVVIGAAYITCTGFMKSSSAYIGDYSLSEDGKKMTVSVFVSSSAGYVRKTETHTQENRFLIDCYYAFGGFNGSIGAKEKYVITISDDTEIISIYRGRNNYEDVLKKDNGTWQRIKQ